MDFTMPATFPEDEFRAFAISASVFFPAAASNEALFDPQEKRRQIERSWQAVRYRYRSCAECQDEFKAVLDNASEAWWATGLGDEELTYKLERCIYLFFTSGLSVFDSFAFCLYFLGHAIQPGTFPDVAKPRNITRKATSSGFNAAFPQAKITGLLAALPGDASFSIIDEVRTLLGHRLSGRRSVRVTSRIEPDGRYTHTHEETWYIPGLSQKLEFDEDMLHRQLDEITRLLTALASAAREFAENNQPATAQP
jgi:hypothetical protein